MTENRTYPKEVFDISISPKGTYAISAHQEDGVRLWSIPDKRLVGAIRFDEAVLGVAIHEETAIFLSDKAVRVWSINRHEVDEVHEINGFAGGIAFLSPDTYVHSNGHGLDIRVIGGKTRIGRLGESRISLYTVANREDIIVACNGGDIVVWRGDEERVVERAHGGPNYIGAFDISENGSRLLSVGNDNMLRMWSLDDLSMILEVDLKDMPFDVAFLPDEKKAAVLGGLKLLEVDLTTGELTEHGDMGPIHRGRIAAGALSQDGSIAVCSGISVKDVTVWDVAKGELLHRFKAHTKQ